LKKNVLWHDGAPFSADDVLFTYETITSPKIFTPYATNFKKVKRVEVLDKYTLKITYKEPYFKALEIWMMGVLPKHLLENEQDLMSAQFNKNPVGTGPYTMGELKISQDIILSVNKNYFDEVPKIEKIHYQFVPDPTTSFYMLQQKKLDLGGLTPIQIDRQIDQKFHNEFSIYEQPSFSYTYLGFNLKNKKFKNKKIREAIALAIDKKQIIDILFFGHAQACNGPFLPGTFAFNEKVTTPSTDIKKAKELLKSLGYDEQNRFVFEVITNANNSTRVNTAQIIQHQLQKVGIEMKIRVMEWQAFLNTVVHPRKFEAIIMGWGLALMPDARSIWHSSSDVTGGFNFVGFNNKKVDTLIEEGEVTIDQNRLSKIYKEIFQQIVDENPYIFLYIPNNITAVNNTIKNVTPSLIGVMHNQQEWIKIEE
jgi:peptide/nickel transport system substrate-binding protein